MGRLLHDWGRNRNDGGGFFIVCVLYISRGENFYRVRYRRGKGKEVDLYSAYCQYNSTTKRSDVDHIELPANTPHLPFLRIRIR